MPVDSQSGFPRSKQQALAMLYVQSHLLPDMTPEEIAIMYHDAYSKIDAKLDELRKDLKEKKREQEMGISF